MAYRYSLEKVLIAYVVFSKNPDGVNSYVRGFVTEATAVAGVSRVFYFISGMNFFCQLGGMEENAQSWEKKADPVFP